MSHRGMNVKNKTINIFLVPGHVDDFSVRKQPTSTISSEIDYETLEQHISDNFIRIQRDRADAANSDEQVNKSFILQGPRGSRVPFTMTDRIAASIVSFFHRELDLNCSGTWKNLIVKNCRMNQAMHEVLAFCKNSGLFPSWTMREMDIFESEILRLYCRENVTLQSLCVERHVLTMDFLEDLLSALSNILDTKATDKWGLGSIFSSSSSTVLRQLGLQFVLMDPQTAEILARGLRNNDCLIELNLRQCGDLTSGLTASLIASLEGHPNLQSLNISNNIVSDSTARALKSVMQSEACKITTLDLKQCRSQRVIEGQIQIMPWLDTNLVVDALKGCQSLRQLLLGKPNELQAHRILNLVGTCPNLREIDLASAGIAEAFWRLSGIQEGAFEGEIFTGNNSDWQRRKNLIRLNISGNPFMIKPKIDLNLDAQIQDLLLQYPAIGDINECRAKPPRAPHTVLSSRTIEMLAFNYAGRGRLREAVPTVLWPWVLKRISPASRNGLFYYPIHNRNWNMERLLLSCQASVLFMLLTQDPTKMALELCRSLPS